MQKILITTLLFFSLFSCDTKKEKTLVNKEKTEENQNINHHQIKKCEALLIIAEDRSGSSHDHRKMIAEDYSAIFKEFNRKFSGQIAVRIIGNPLPEEREFFMLNVLPEKNTLPIDESAKMSIKGKIIKENEKILAENNQILDQNNKNIEAFVKEKITKHILNYKPYQNKDLTNIEDALHHVSLKVNEPTFSDYSKIFVLIVSDGIHDATKLKKPLSFETQHPIQLFLVGWKDLKVFDNITTKNNFESVEGFFSYFNKITCK